MEAASSQCPEQNPGMSRHTCPRECTENYMAESYPLPLLSFLNSQYYTAPVLRDGYVSEVTPGYQSEFLCSPELLGLARLFF